LGTNRGPSAGSTPSCNSTLSSKPPNISQPGSPPDEARRRASIEFGGVERFKEECREARWENRQGAAAHWYLQAADTGDSQAQYNLADFYLHSEGVSQDDAAAFVWFQKAAAQGRAGARIMLGSMYAVGRGTAKDLLAAYLWISAAALPGDTRGSALLLSLERELTAAQLAQAKLRVRSLVSASGRSRHVASLH
jgi:TPR repeat protein